MNNPKLSVICALYIGNRPVQVDDIIYDKLYYFKKQLEHLEQYTDKIHKFYFVTTFENNKYKKKYTDKLLEYQNNKIYFTFKENVGGSYTSWKSGLKLDNGESDLIFLIEDDYVLYNTESIESIVDDFKRESDLFYYCGLWRDNHAAVSNGIINNKMFIESKLEFDTIDSIDRNTLFINQEKFLEPFRLNNYKIKDYAQKYSSQFSHGVNNIQEFGVKDSSIIFKPLTITK